MHEYGLTERGQNDPVQAPWRNPETQPPNEWPALGNVVYSNYTAAYREEFGDVLRCINFKARDGEKVSVYV